ncbi:hypothetical protein ACIQNU_08965 [Streptomyces sp. NPDC091292]
MSTRAVLVAAVVTALVLGIVNQRADACTRPCRSGSLAVAGH